MHNLPSKEEIIEGWEYILTHKAGSMEDLIRTTINTLRGNPDLDRQKAIDTWSHIVAREKLSPAMSRRIDATLYYMLRSSAGE